VSAVRRRILLATLLAASAVCTPAASAAITGTVLDTRGAPVSGAVIGFVDATGQNDWRTSTDLVGHFTLNVSTAAPGPVVFPGTLYVSFSDRCTQGTYPSTQIPVAADGAAVGPVTFAVNAFCSLTAPMFGFHPPEDATAYVDPDAGRVISAPGGVAWLRLQIPDASTGNTVTYAGAPIGGYGTGGYAKLTAPATPGSGPMSVTFTADGVTATRLLGTLTVTGGTPLPVSSAGADFEVALDVSGSMATADTQALRKTALHDLLDRARPGDRLGAFAFDAQADPIFTLQPITPANAGSLATLGDRAIAERGATDFDVAFAQASADLTAPGAYDPARPKVVILLTDGSESADAYGNTHLLLAGNPTGRPWPVCVVQMAPRFEAGDVALLRRFSGETAGVYTAVTAPADVPGALDRCLGRSGAGPAVTTRAVTFTRPGTSRQVTTKLAAGLASAAFRADFARGGKLTPVLIDPNGRRHTVTAPGSGIVYKHSATASAFQVRRPAAGTWKLVLTAKALVSGKLSAHIRVTQVKA
jgi:hypothetical protein